MFNKFLLMGDTNPTTTGKSSEHPTPSTPYYMNSPPPPYSPPAEPYTSQMQSLTTTQQQQLPSSYPRQQQYFGSTQFQPGSYPPSSGGHYGPPVMTNSYGAQPAAPIGPYGVDTSDSDGEDFVHTKSSKHPIEVKFVNRTRTKVNILWIDEEGNYDKITSLKPNTSKELDTWETHPFVALSKNEVVINGNFVFFPHKSHGSYVNIAEITDAPRDIHSIRSPLSGHPVTLKFSNRTDEMVSVKWVNVHGQPQPIKDIAPKQAWLFNSCEGHYFIACERGRENEYLALNKGWFYLAKRAPTPQTVMKVLITEPQEENRSSDDDIIGLF